MASAKEKLTYTYYPGCSVTGANRNYDISTRAIAKGLGIEINELDDWNCCGSTAYFAVGELRSFLISSRNLAMAEKTGNDLVTICNGCFTILNKTNIYMSENKRLREDVKEGLSQIGMDYNLGVRVRHLIDILANDLGLERIKGRVTKPLTGLKVAPYYGCQLSRPRGTLDDPEYPMILDNLLDAVGAEVVNFPLKAKCCGGMLMSTNESIGLQLTGDLLRCAIDNGADIIATICPLCHMNLEGYQKEIGLTLPVLYFTQVLGLAIGQNKKELGINMGLIPFNLI